MNVPHVVHYSEWLKNPFFIRPTFKSYEDSWGVVHEVTSAIVVTDLFGAPKERHATITVRCGGGLKVPLERLQNAQSVSCWECLSR